MIGTVLSNRYKLIAELGSGGMAWVYLAEDLIQGGEVAVKILYPQHSKDHRFVQRFSREAQLAMSVSRSAPQPNVVCVLDYGADRDTHYLVMEYVPGQDLGEVLEQQGALPWQKALHIARQVALALSHAHKLDIVHRDIKPSNIMVLSDGTTRVLDFGIARVGTSPHITLAGFVGSPHYAAPEQAQGQPVDIRADIYSLGIVLYRMLSGDLPFKGDTPWAVVNQHVVSAPTPLPDLRPDLPDPVALIVKKAMAREPWDRFQTPQEMVEAIDAVLAESDDALETLAVTPKLDLAAIYQRAQQAASDGRWQEAIDLFSQILRVDPDYRDTASQVDAVAQRVHLVTLYRLAQRSLETAQWDQALSQLDKIASIEPAYRDTDEMRSRAEKRESAPVGSDADDHDFPTHVPAVMEQPEPTQDAASSEHRSAPDLSLPHSGRGRRRWLLLVGGPILLLLLSAAGVLLLSAVRQPEPTPTLEAWQSPVHTSQPSVTPSPTAALPASPTAEPPPAPQPAITGETVATATVTATSSPTPREPAGSTTSSPTPRPTHTSTPTPSLTPTATATQRPQLSGQIAFPRFDPARQVYDTYACNVNGSGCSLVYAGASQPDFLPGGSRLVVHIWEPEHKGLTLITRSGERIWRITDQVEAARPSVDSRGDLYVYHSRVESDRQPRLYRTYGAETAPILREANPVLGQSPSWLPDGHLLYSGCWQDDCGILVSRADGSYPQQVVAGASETNPEASPNGERIAFMSLRDGNWEVYLARIDGGSPVRLTENAANDGLPTWSPDGRFIAFVTDRDGPWAIWVMRPDGMDQRKLFDIAGPLDGQVRDAAAHESHGWVEERISWAPLP